MFNWQKMCANTAGYSDLHEELRNCRGRYILEGVKMPESCGSQICTIEFRYHGEDYIQMRCLDSPVAYNGGNPRIAQWLENGTLEFGSFDQLTAFLKQFNEESTPRNNRSPQRTPTRPTTQTVSPETMQIPERPEMEYDRDSITVPDTQRSYVVIDKDKLILDLNNEIFGQEENIQKIVHLVRNHLGTKNRTRPISIFLYGPPGTGKSKVAELLVEKVNKQLTPREQLFYRPVDCTQFQDKADISRLTGAAPGYVGFDEPGVFSVLEDHPNTVFVFEEIEKAASNVTEVIMQAMETGRQETNGKTLRNGASYYDLSHSIIFFTSNITIEDRKQVGFGSTTRQEPVPEPITGATNIARVISMETKTAKEKFLESGKFRREVISRMAAIIKFDGLTGDTIKDIAAKSIRDIAENHRLYITKIETPVLQEFINVTSGETEDFGARELRREADNFFGEAFLDYSHRHEDYAKIIVSGTLDEVEILPG